MLTNILWTPEVKEKKYEILAFFKQVSNYLTNKIRDLIANFSSNSPICEQGKEYDGYVDKSAPIVKNLGVHSNPPRLAPSPSPPIIPIKPALPPKAPPSLPPSPQDDIYLVANPPPDPTPSTYYDSELNPRLAVVPPRPHWLQLDMSKEDAKIFLKEQIIVSFDNFL